MLKYSFSLSRGTHRGTHPKGGSGWVWREPAPDSIRGLG